MKVVIKGIRWFCCLFLLLAAAAACGGGSSGQESVEETPGISPSPAGEETPTVSADLPQGSISQWAVEAEASSVFSDPEWSAEQATGPPDAPVCGDAQFAWASAASDSIDTLTVRYAVPVVPLKINIIQSYHPDQVVKVEVFQEERQTYYTVLQKNPEPVDRPCPFELEVNVTKIDFPIDQVRITVDQSQLGLGWNEIDAVELIGLEN